MKKVTKKNNHAGMLREWTDLLTETTSVWFTPERVNKVKEHARNFLSERAKHYYDIDEFGMDPNLVESIRPLFQFLYHEYWRIETIGINNIPSKGKGLIVANHSGAIPFDGIMINMAIFNEHPKSRNVRFLVEDFVYHFPFIGTFISRTGGVRACRENAQRILSKGNLVAVFPEGVKGIGKLYKDKYKLQRFGRSGYVKIAMETKSKIIPTAIIGAEETYPVIAKTTALTKPLGIPYFPISPTFPLLGPLGLIPLPSKWIMIFGKPIDFSKYKPSDANNNLLVHRLNEQIKDEIKKMIKEGLSKRDSIWS
jgi:1-acyl-sn-glycerol-3-phosphate acyltransferase